MRNAPVDEDLRLYARIQEPEDDEDDDDDIKEVPDDEEEEDDSDGYSE